jgi:hypothetical protein
MHGLLARSPGGAVTRAYEIVGIASVVVENVPPGLVVVGNP